MMQRLGRTTVIGLSALAICGAGTGVALASTSTAAPAVAAQSPAPTHGKAHARTAGYRGLHGEFTGVGKAHRTVDYQHGTVTGVAGGSVTVRSADGFTQTYAFGPKPAVRKDGKPAAPSAVQTGDRVFVVALEDPTGLRATLVRDRGPAPAPAPSPAPAPAPATPN